MKWINKSIRIIILSIKRELAYSIKIFSNIVLIIIDVFIFYSIWKAIYSSGNSFGDINYDQIITYIILARLLFQLFSWGINIQISKLIKNGDITVQLTRPVDFQFLYYFLRIGEFIQSIFIQSVPVIIIGVFLGLNAPIAITNFLLFLLSLIGAVSISFLIEFMIACITFFTVSSWGIQCFKQAVIAFFSGSFIPIDLMPSALQQIVNIMPFQSMIYFPVSIYIGNTDTVGIISGFLLQLFWIVVLFILSRLVYRYSIRKVTIAGG